MALITSAGRWSISALDCVQHPPRQTSVNQSPIIRAMPVARSTDPAATNGGASCAEDQRFAQGHTLDLCHAPECSYDAHAPDQAAAYADDDSSGRATRTLDQQERAPLDVHDLGGPHAFSKDEDHGASGDESAESRQRRRIHQSAKRLADSGSLSLRELLRGLLPLLPRDQALCLALLVRDVMCGNLQLSMGDFQEYVRTVLSDEGISILRQFTSVVGELQARRRARPSSRGAHLGSTIRLAPDNLRQRRCHAWAPY